jgi:hypothetical protein
MKRLPKIGSRISITWDDVCAFTNQELHTVKPSRCWTEGILVKATKDMIVVASSQYDDNETGDYTVFPRSEYIISIKKLK